MSSLISFHELVLYLTLKNICQMYIKAKVATPNFFLLNVRRFLFHVISNTISFAQNRSERFLFLAFCHKNWQSLRYLCLRKYVICSCKQRNTTEKIVTAHERFPIGLANRRANLSYSIPVCNKIYNFHFSAYFKLFARSETKNHLFTLQVRVF